MKHNWVVVELDTHKLDNAVWVKCIAEIRNNLTGEIRECETDEILGLTEDSPYTFIWEDGNYACDCNRRIFFEENGEQGNTEEISCSNGKYYVNLKNKKDLKYYYKEF